MEPLHINERKERKRHVAETIKALQKQKGQVMKKKSQAVIYARQSSGDEDQSLSVDIQIENCQKLAKERGITVVGIYKDLNISGKFYPAMSEAEIFAAKDHALQVWAQSTSTQKLKSRTGLGEALSNRSGINYLIVDDYTRLMRPLANSYLGVFINQILVSAKIKLLCVKDGEKDPASGYDNILTNLLSSLNAMQLENQRMKSKASLQRLKNEGYRPSGSKLRGYKHVGKHKYEIVPEEAALIKEAFELGIANISYMEICRRLSAKYNFKDLYYDTLKTIYLRPEYAGYAYNSNGELIESKCFGHIPIITLDQFNQMQKRLSNKRIHNHDRKNVYAFTGLCYCGYCGNRMQVASCSGMPPSENEMRVYYFTCTRNVYRDYRKECGSSHIRYMYPFRYNWHSKQVTRHPVTAESLKKPLIPDQLYNTGLHESLMALVVYAILEERRKLSSYKHIQDKIAKLELEKQRIADKEKKFADLFYRDSIEAETFEKNSNQLKQDREKVQREIMELTALSTIDPQAQKEELQALLYQLQLKFFDCNLYKKYAQQIIKRINIFGYHIEIILNNDRKIILERIAKCASRLLPDWSLSLKGNKAYIKYYYKSFYKGDTREQEIYDDSNMNIVTVGCNPKPGAWKESKNHEWDWRKQEILSVNRGITQ